MIKNSAFQMASLFIFIALALLFSTLLYYSYQDYVHPKHVYGTWIELGAPPYQTEILTLSEHGVLRNNKLIATQFEFNGKRVTIHTGNGNYVYKIAGTLQSPQLKRLEPSSTTQRFIKQGYEHTVASAEDDPAKHRRAALSEHFDGG